MIKMNQIRKITIEKNIKQQDLANYLNVHPRQVQRYEKNNDSIRVSKAIMIADYLDVSLDFLVNRKNYIEKYGKEDFLTEEQILFNKLNKKNQKIAMKILKVLEAEQNEDD